MRRGVPWNRCRLDNDDGLLPHLRRLGPWYAAGSGATSTETINLNDIPAGSVCKVSIARGTSAVKGSSTAYSVPS